MAKKSKNARWGIAILIIFHAVGLAGFNIPSLQPTFIKLVPYHLLLCLGVLLAFHQPWKGKFIVGVLLVMLAGWAIEWVGVQTGKIFGPYHYGATLGRKVDGVPILIGVNWFILLYSSLMLAESIVKINWLKCVLAGILMVLMDILIEPVAVNYDYWHWHVLHIPLQNYIVWGVVGALMAFGFSSIKQKLQNPVAVPLYFIQLTFFMLMNLLL